MVLCRALATRWGSDMTYMWYNEDMGYTVYSGNGPGDDPGGEHTVYGPDGEPISTSGVRWTFLGEAPDDSRPAYAPDPGGGGYSPIPPGGGSAPGQPGSATPGGTPGGTPGTGGYSDTAALLTRIRALYPWAERLGLIDLIIGKVREDASDLEILAEIRSTPQWQRQFPAFYAEDGSKRFDTESQYMKYVDDLRNVMKDFGVYDPALEAPENYIGLMEEGVDPNEFRDRFSLYRQLEEGTKELRDAFYLYAGLDVTTDDMYRATVDPGFQQYMETEYDTQVAGSSLDYETYISRATDLAVRDLSKSVGAAVSAGIIPAGMLTSVINMSLDTARGWLDVLYTNGGQDRYLSFDELNQSFQYAVLASAASERGLGLPTVERLQEFVQAGVSRANANRAYSTFAKQQFGLAGMSARANLQQEIDQSLFEEAMLLSDARSQAVINKAFDQEVALGRAGGGFGQQLEGRRVTQVGR